MADPHLDASDVAEYWTPDAAADAVVRVETHVFACADCARRLEAERALIDGVCQAVRRGRLQAIVTDAVVNRLAREGARMRTFTVDPGAVVPCAVWSDDEVIVTRMRIDLTGLERVSIVTQVAGEEVDRVTDVAVGPQARELIEVFSAEQLRQLPRTEVRLQVFGSRGQAGDELIAEYILEHGGALDRRAADV